MPFTYRNHYVPRLYLKNFADDRGYRNTYRLLVPKSTVRVWKRTHVLSIGYQQNLYTRLLQGSDSDEIESWLNEECENPAESSLRKAISGERLYPDDYKKLVRLLASQIVRTPAFLVKGLPRWCETTKQWLEDMSQNLPEYLSRTNSRFAPTPSKVLPQGYLPMRVTKEETIDGQVGIRIEAVVGRVAHSTEAQPLHR